MNGDAMSLFAVSCLFFSYAKAGLSNASWKVVKSLHLSNRRIELSFPFFQKLQTKNISERNTQGLHYPQPKYRFILNTILYIFPPNRVWRGIGVEAINHPNFRISFPPPQHQKPKWSFWESFLCSLVSPLPLLYSLGLLQRWNLKDDLLASNTFIWKCGSSRKLPEPLIFSLFFNKWKRIVICFIALLVFYPIQQIEHLILNFLLSYTNGSYHGGAGSKLPSLQHFFQKN